jgi:hypothetical protein
MALTEQQVKWLGIALGGGGALALVLVSRRRSARGGAPPSRRARAEVIQAINEQLVAHHPRVPSWFAMAQADKESGFDNTARNNRPGIEDSYGLYQINWRAHGPTLTARGITPAMLFDPRVNAAYAFELFEQLRAAAIARGFPADSEQLWHAVRLRLAGIPWEDFDGPRPSWTADARRVVAAFEPFVARYRGLA